MPSRGKSTGGVDCSRSPASGYECPRQNHRPCSSVFEVVSIDREFEGCWQKFAWALLATELPEFRLASRRGPCRHTQPGVVQLNAQAQYAQRSRVAPTVKPAPTDAARTR